MIEWRKSSRSGGDSDPACVELAKVSAEVWVRDSRDPNGKRLELGRKAFSRFLARVKRDELNL
jgi:hypothetical protein